MTLENFYSEKLIQLKEKKIPSPRLDLDLIFGEVLNIERHQIILKHNEVLDETTKNKINSMLERRSTGEPLAYIFGYKYFYKSKFIVNRNVLVPRPETELIVEKSLKLMTGVEKLSILDMGCGSGCIGLTLINELKQASLISIDICEKALNITKENYKYLNLKNDFQSLQADIKTVPINEFINTFDLIVANPPYIDEADGFVQDSVKQFEPNKALFSAERGFQDISLWTEKAFAWLKPGGYFLMEFGENQCQRLENFFEKEQKFVEYSIHKDYSNLPRFIVAKKSEGQKNG